MISRSGDVQLNPGPKDKSSSTFSICYWNLNSIATHSNAKVSFLQAYIATQKFDIVCISEIYVDSNTAYDDGNLEIAGYDLMRSDHPLNKKRGDICIYYKNSLPLRVLSIHYWQECVNFKLKISGKLCNFIYFYRCPRQTQDEFEKFSENLERNLDDLLQNNPFLVAVISDFNVKSNNWYCYDKSSLEGDTVYNEMSSEAPPRKLNTTIESFNQMYYYRITNKLNNTQKKSRSCWSLMKIFLTTKKYHK